MSPSAGLAVRRGTQRLRAGSFSGHHPDVRSGPGGLRPPGLAHRGGGGARSLALDDHEVGSTLDQVVTGFDGRHRDLLGTFERHAAAVADRLEPGCELSDERRLLLGATFTSEYAIEGAALCNPSMRRPSRPVGRARGQPAVRDERPRRRRGPSVLDRLPDRHDRRRRAARPSILRRDSRSPGRHEPVALRRRHLPERAPPARQPRGERRLRPRRARRTVLAGETSRRGSHELQANLTTRRHAERTIDVIRSIAERTYGVEFPADTTLPERVLWPSMSAECHGMEDARFVRFTHDDGRISLLRDLHRLRRRPHQPAAAGDHRLLRLHVLTPGR